MRSTLLILLITFSLCLAGNSAIDPMQVNWDDDWLQYDDGTAQWLTWGGTYRGTWFNLQDFIPGCTQGVIGMSRLWFYHHTNYPWDTSDVYVELWSGDETGPVTLLDQALATALHYAPIYIEYPSGIIVGEDFWCLANTELSAGGWPSLLGDGFDPDPTGIAHSFFSDDFIVWEPWNINGACYYFIATQLFVPLDRSTWGEIKTVF